MKIIQISATYVGRGHLLYGLSNDGKAYRWDFSTRTWLDLATV